jgi:lipid A disaccharide synthetase
VGARDIISKMQEEIVNEHIDDNSHPEKIENNLDESIKEQNQMKRLVDLFMLALLLIFAMYSIL